MKKTKFLLIALLLIFLSLTAAGCRGSGAVASSWPGITVDGDTAYVAYNQYVYAIDLANDGKQTAKLPEEGIRGATFFHHPVLVQEDKLLEGSYNQDLYLIDIQDENYKEFFTSAKNRWIGAPIVVDDVIYAPNSNGSLYALDLDGEEIWSFATEASIWASPIIVDNTIYVTSMDHFLYALNISDGSEIWRYDLGATAVDSPTLDDNGTLYVGTFNSELIALNSETGSKLWAFETDDWVWGSPTLGPDNTLYVTDLSANIYALDLDNPGETKWEKQVETDATITGSVLVYNDSLYVVTDAGSITAYDLDGERLWKEEILEGNFYGTPVVGGEDLIMVSALNAESIIYAYNTDLEPLWQYMPENK